MLSLSVPQVGNIPNRIMRENWATGTDAASLMATLSGDNTNLIAKLSGDNICESDRELDSYDRLLSVM